MTNKCEKKWCWKAVQTAALAEFTVLNKMAWLTAYS